MLWHWVIILATSQIFALKKEVMDLEQIYTALRPKDFYKYDTGSMIQL